MQACAKTKYDDIAAQCEFLRACVETRIGETEKRFDWALADLNRIHPSHATPQYTPDVNSDMIDSGHGGSAVQTEDVPLQMVRFDASVGTVEDSRSYFERGKGHYTAEEIGTFFLQARRDAEEGSESDHERHESGYSDHADANADESASDTLDGDSDYDYNPPTALEMEMLMEESHSSRVLSSWRRLSRLALITSQ